VILQLRLRQQTNANPAPLTLQEIEETARLVDPMYETLDHSQPTSTTEEQRRKGGWKRGREKQSQTPSSETKKLKLHCDNHPDSTSHSTSECRLKRQKESSDGNPKLQQHPSANRTPQSDQKKSKLSPQDQAWICYKCKQKAPGHFPEDCPKK